MEILLPSILTDAQSDKYISPEELTYWKARENRTFYIDYEIDETYELLELGKIIIQMNMEEKDVKKEDLKPIYLWVHSYGGDLEQWLTLFNGSPIVVNRKSQDDIICISNPFVSVIGSMQPGLLAKVFRGDKKEDGFLPRILFVNNSSYNQPMLWKDEDLPITAPSDWERILLHIIEKSRPYNGRMQDFADRFCICPKLHRRPFVLAPAAFPALQREAPLQR